VQRNVGVEVEESNWRALDEAGDDLSVHEPVVRRSYFDLEAEAPRGIEMVTTAPGVANRGDYERMKRSMHRLETELADQQYRAGLADTAARLPATRLLGGRPGVFLQPGPRWAPHLQVTAGIPLAGIPTFFRHLRDQRVDVQTRSADQIESRLAHVLKLPAAPTASASRDDDRARHRAPSRELLGFTELLNHYLNLGANTRTARFSKAVFGVLARTDFAKSFSLLPPEEQQAISRNLAEWVDLMVTSFAVPNDPAADRTPSGPALGTAVLVANTRFRVRTSRDEWLRGMVRGHDVLSNHGRTSDPRRGRGIEQRLGYDVEMDDGDQWIPALDPDPDVRATIDELEAVLYGLGRFGETTDLVRYRNTETGEVRNVEALIVEVRRTTGVRPRPGGWIAAADGIYDAVEAAVAEAGSAVQGATGRGTFVALEGENMILDPGIPRDTARQAVLRRLRNTTEKMVLKARHRLRRH
jgi:hypothetical protein